MVFNIAFTFIALIAISIIFLLLYRQILPFITLLRQAKKKIVGDTSYLTAIFDHAAEGIITIDTEGIIESFNPAASEMFGYKNEELLGKNIEILIPYELREKHREGMKRYLKTHDSDIVGKHSVEIPALQKNGETFLMELSITEMKINHKIKFVGMMHNISQRKAYENKLLENETRFRLAFDYSPIGMALVSLEGRWLKVNKALCDIVGYTESELLQIDFQTITYPDDLQADLDNVKQLYEGKIAVYRMEKRYIRKDKKLTWILLTATIIRNDQGAPLYYISQIQDINDKKRAEEELSFRANYDTLTGLLNRNQLEHHLDLAISSALRYKKKFAIFFIDLDHFKNVNDTLGHVAGDQLLKIVSDIFRKNIRKSDIAARLGGDEFVLLLNDIHTPETAAIFAEQIMNMLSDPIKIKEHELNITASIGISFYPTDGKDHLALLKSADLALYKAKEEGRNNYQFCTAAINAEVQAKVAFKNALKIAVKRQEFFLTFLPKIDFKKRIIGFEALLRWKNKHYHDISPDKIIPLAEETGIIGQLSSWVVQTACQQTLIWQKEFKFPLKIAVNIATRDYMQPNFVDNLLLILKNVNLPPDQLQLEINENLIMQDPDYSLATIKLLKKHSIQTIIDNFGTGYSSLNYLNQFSVDYIKIDRVFTQHIMTNHQHRILVSAMVALAKSLNIKILASGIESKEQYLLLSELGCDQFEGYYFSHPLVTEEVSPFLQESVK